MPAPDTNTLPSYSDDLALLVSVASNAAPIAMAYFDKPDTLNVEMKNGVSPVSAGDFAVDTYLRETLLAERPDYGWLSEETADADPQARMLAPRTFVVDPIDGTRAYIAGQTNWCISAAIVEGQRPVAGVLVCPALNEVYAASIGDGATCNGAPMARLDDEEPSQLVAGNRKLVSTLDARSASAIAHHPHVPSLAYRLAMVSSGRLGGTFVRSGSHDWDIAAAMVLLEETGCVMAGHNRQPVALNEMASRKADLLAAHPRLFDDMMGVADG